jgi:tRNA nucleotidyltransferase (CCA-adding enzyme)
MSLRQGIVYLVWFIPLGEETALAIANRFHLNNTLLNSIHSACLLWSEQNVLAELKPSEFFDRVESCSLIAGYALYLLAEPGPFKEKILAALTRWLTLIPDTDGNKLKALGLTPGPRYGELIHQLRSAWINGEVATVQQEKVLLEKLLIH